MGLAIATRCLNDPEEDPMRVIIVCVSELQLLRLLPTEARRLHGGLARETQLLVQVRVELVSIVVQSQKPKSVIHKRKGQKHD